MTAFRFFPQPVKPALTSEFYGTVETVPYKDSGVVLQSSRAPEKPVYFVIPSAARNLSDCFARRCKEQRDSLLRSE
jgi:hypothetical protein